MIVTLNDTRSTPLRRRVCGCAGAGGLSCADAKHTAASTVPATIACRLRRVGIGGASASQETLGRPHGQTGPGDRDVDLLGRKMSIAFLNLG